jgi:hypothetical protein
MQTVADVTRSLIYKTGCAFSLCDLKINSVNLSLLNILGAAGPTSFKLSPFGYLWL